MAEAPKTAATVEATVEAPKFVKIKNISNEDINFSGGCIKQGDTGEITAAEYAVHAGRYVEKA